ncbi:MAG: phosphate signaling complex protein PhoU [Oscillospiraceae bacterium]|nr:phosphate signaling complex protein PhoU [Oscillospiraceae bacterium]
MRSRFDEQLKELNDSLIEMGQIVKDAIAAADKALIEQDVELAGQVIAVDDDIDKAEKDIESLCLKLLLLHHPVARDLRLVSSVLKIITDLERIGDHATDISELTILLAGMPYIKNLEHISQMASVTMKMVTGSIDAFVKKDLALANEIIEMDDIVDNLFIMVKSDMIDLIKADPDNGDQAIDLIMVAKYFERIGDHATNVAEWVVFSITGSHKSSEIL